MEEQKKPILIDPVVISGSPLEADKPTLNRRIYSRASLEKAAQDVNERAAGGTFFGTLGLDSGTELSSRMGLSEAAFAVLPKARVEDDVLKVDVELLQTEQGRAARNMLESGLQLSVQVSGIGSVVEKDGLQIVQDDYKLTSVSLVPVPDTAEEIERNYDRNLLQPPNAGSDLLRESKNLRERIAKIGPLPPQGLYWWVRDDDETGMSGKGRVAQVAVFEDRSAVLRWLAGRNTAGTSSTVIYESIVDLLWVHGHGEKRTGHLESQDCSPDIVDLIENELADIDPPRTADADPAVWVKVFRNLQCVRRWRAGRSVSSSESAGEQ